MTTRKNVRNNRFATLSLETLETRCTPTTGVLSITQAITPVRPHILVAGQGNEPGLMLTAKAVGGTFRIADLHIPVVNGGQLDGIRIEAQSDRGFVTVGRATVGATGSDDVPEMIGGVRVDTFTARLGDSLQIKSDTERDLRLVPILRGQSEGLQPGTQVQFLIDADNRVNLATGWGAVHAFNVDTGDVLLGNDGRLDGFVRIGSYTGDNRLIRGTVHTTSGIEIERIEALKIDPDGTPVPTGFSQIARHRITFSSNDGSHQYGADRGELGKLTYKIDAGNVDADPRSLRVYNLADVTRWASPAGITPIEGGFIATFNVSELDLIAGGNQSLTVSLGAEVRNSQVSSRLDSHFQATLLVGPTEIEWANVDARERTTYSRTDLLDTRYPGTLYGNRAQPTPPAKADVAVEVTGLDTAGDLATFEIIVSNLGPAAAHDVTVGMPTPRGTTIFDADSAFFPLNGGTSMNAAIGALRPGESRSLVVTYDTFHVPTGETVTAKAYVTSDTHDPNPANNHGQFGTVVDHGPVTPPVEDPTTPPCGTQPPVEQQPPVVTPPLPSAPPVVDEVFGGDLGVLPGTWSGDAEEQEPAVVVPAQYDWRAEWDSWTMLTALVQLENQRRRQAGLPELA
jgi:uncharacterized repeat protein (TIGR01451 family)